MIETELSRQALTRGIANRGIFVQSRFGFGVSFAQIVKLTKKVGN